MHRCLTVFIFPWEHRELQRRWGNTSNILPGAPNIVDTVDETGYICSKYYQATKVHSIWRSCRGRMLRDRLLYNRARYQNVRKNRSLLWWTYWSCSTSASLEYWPQTLQDIECYLVVDKKMAGVEFAYK